jgi:hypothetical protein
MSEEEKGGWPEEEFSAVLSGLDRAAPLLRALTGGASAQGEGEAREARHSLLCALKPYLSPSRCEAVDYLLRLWQVGDTIKRLMGEG